MVSLISRLSSRKLFRGALRWCLGLAATVTPALVAPDMAHATTPTPRWDALNEPGTQGRGSMMRVSPFDSNTAIISGDQWGSSITTDGGATWQSCLGFTNLTTGNTPDENDFTFIDAMHVWAGTVAGPFLSTDGGHNWTSMRSGMPAINPQFSFNAASLPIQKIIQDPNTPATLYAFSGSHRQLFGVPAFGQVWKSINGGTSWTGPIGQVTPLNSMHPELQGVNDCCFARASSTIMYAATANGLYKSVDSGANWNPVSGTPATVACYCVVADPTANTNIVYAGFDKSGTTGNGVYKTTDGTNWLQIVNNIDNGTGGKPNDLDAPVLTIAPAPSNPQVVYLGFNGATYFSSNGGGLWTKIVWAGTNNPPVSPPSGVPGNLTFQWLSVDSANAAIVWGNGESNVWRSTNSGVTWQTLTNAPANSAYRGNGCSGLDGTMAAWNPNIPGQVWTSGWDSGKQLRSADYLWSWLTGDTFTGSVGPYNGSFGVTFAKAGSVNTVYIATGQASDKFLVKEPIIKYVPGGSPVWSYLTYPGAGASVGECDAVYTFPNDPTKIWAVFSNSTQGRIWYSADSGTSWTDITPSIGGTVTYVFSLAANPLDTNFVYIGTSNGVFKSNSGGASFPNAIMPGSQSNGTSSPNFIFLDPGPTTKLYQVLWKRSATNIYHFDGVNTWAPLTYVSWMEAARAVAVDPNNPSRLAVSTRAQTPNQDINWGSGIYLSSDGGGSWTPYNSLKLNSVGGPIAFNPDKSSQLIAPMDGGDLVCDWGTSTPNGGTAANIIGSINSINYDLGGANIAYSGSTAPNPATVAGTAGQWIKYQVNVPITGYYSMTLQAKSSVASAPFPQYHIEVNGVNVTGPILVNSTSLSNYVKTVYLTAGIQYLKVYSEVGGGFYNTISTTGSLSGSLVDATAPYNLTSLGTTDWAHWGRAGTYTNFDHKTGPVGKITTVVPFGTGENHGGFSSSTHQTKWTDGTPTGSDLAENGYIWSNGSLNTGFTFTAPATTSLQTLSVFCGGSDAQVTLIAHLSNASIPDYTTSFNGPGIKLLNLSYQTSTSGTLTITLEKTGNLHGQTTGSADLVAAWLH
jgi:hypothetical protein